ncbi:PrsW family glutamic-type intramembrane protease [Haloferax namakaokahaiae]|uniref:PrsW family glutamic-type intramembrane protease n=1 Tax=Haloferax namakaokahaiae TaxID=1748331 RepID=A0ABD5ZJJ4_9EURY
MMLSLSIALVFPLLLLVAIVDDRNTRAYLGCFAWGCMAGFIAFSGNNALFGIVEITRQQMAVQFAPITEEVIKASPLFIAYLYAPKRFRRRDVVVMAVFVGIGFSVVENFWYLVSSQSRTTVELALFVLTRSFSTTIMHGLATGIVGLTLSSAAQGTFDEIRGLRPVFVFVGTIGAVTLHGYFNMVVQQGVVGEALAIVGALALYVTAVAAIKHFSEEVSEVVA